MGFRDDRDAAFERVEALEQELARKQQELDAIHGVRRAARRRLMAPLLTAMVLALVGAGAAFWMANTSQRAASEREAEAIAAQARRAAEMARGRAAAEELEARARAEAERLRALQAQAEAEAVAARPTATITWAGVVESATGITLAPDAPCALEGTFAGDEPSDFRALRLRCGDEVLYDKSTDAADAHPTGRLRQGPVFGDETHESMLSYTDEAPREGGRRMLTVSTLQHRVVAWRDGDAPMRVTVFVRDVSAPVDVTVSSRMPARVAHAPAFAPVPDRVLRVTAAHGEAPGRVGQRCTFEVRPVWEFPENCRVAIRCGTSWVYGAGEAGYLTCALRDGRPTGALDDRTSGEGGDPKVDWRGNRIVVSDFTDRGAWDLTLSL